MKLHLLLTSDIAQTKPGSCLIVRDFGYEQVIFRGEIIKVGINCIVEDSSENIINWLKPYGEFVEGSGFPQLEQFRLVNLK